MSECWVLQRVETGEYLASYDVNYKPDPVPDWAPEWLRGVCQWTLDPDKAMHFATVGEALECRDQRPDDAPVRGDGQPNRPLTAYTLAIERLPAFV